MESNKTINIFTSTVGMTIENPWAGLASYEDPASSERKLKFCGRDDDTYDMVKLISKNVFVTLYGKSGIGKTSLLNAGVFPELREKQYTPISLRLGILKPTKGPSYQSIIIDAIKRASAHIVEFNVIDEQTNEKSDDYLWNFFARHRFFDINDNPTSPALVLDQFEEVLRTHSKDGEILLRQINYLNDKDNTIDRQEIDGTTYYYKQNFRVVISIREDDLYRLEDCISRNFLPSLRRCRYHLMPLNDDQAELVIREPISGFVSREVAKDIICKVTKSNADDFELGDGIPQKEVDSALLSLFLSELFERWKASGLDTITSNLVKEIGDDIISSFYENAIANISAQSVEYLERRLVTDDEIRDSMFESRAIRGGVSKDDLDYLKQKHIIHTIPWADNLERIELVHDILCPVVKKRKEQRALKEQECQRVLRNIDFNRKKRITESNVLIHKGRRLIDNALDFGEYRCLLATGNNHSVDTMLKVMKIWETTLSAYLEDEKDSDFITQKVFSDPLLRNSSCVLSFYHDSKKTSTIDGIFEVRLKYYGSLITDIYFYGKKVQKDGSTSYGSPLYVLGGYCGIHTDFDDNQRVIQRTYIDDDGRPIITQDGYSIVRFVYDEKGNPIKTRFYHQNNAEIKPARHINGNYGFNSTFDDCGNEIKRIFVDDQEQPTTIVSGVYGKRMIYDKNTFLLTSISNLDANGNLMADIDGYVTIKTLYDNDGKPTVNYYLDENGESWKAPDGTYGSKDVIDQQNMLVTSYFVDNVGNLISQNGGTYKVIMKYNASGQLEEVYSLDNADNYIEDNDHQVFQIYEYDEQSRLSVFKTYNKMKELVFGCMFEYNKEGSHIIRQFILSKNEYGFGSNDFGTSGIEFEINNDGPNLPPLQRFINENKQYVANSIEVNAIRAWEDENGRIVKLMFYDIDGKPMHDNSGIYGKKIEYSDEHTIKTIHLDANENMMEDYNGVAFTIEKNDSSGIFLVQYNINGEPHANDNWVYVFQEKKTTDQGYKKRIYVQDSNKNLITMQHYHKENPNWGIVSCAFRDTYYDDKGRVLSEYFKDAQSNNIGDADGDSYTIWKYDDENKTEIVSLYNTEGILTLRIRKVKDSQNRIVEQSYVYIANNNICFENGVCGKKVEYDDNERKLTIIHIDSNGYECNCQDGYSRQITWYDKYGRQIGFEYITEDGSILGEIEFKDYIETGSHECIYYMHNEDGNGNIIPDANGCTFKYIEDDEKGRHIKIRFLNEDKRPMADKDGIFGQEYKYEDDRHIIEITCIGESGLPINNNQGYCIVHVFKDEYNRESKRMYFDIDGKPAKVNLLLGCNGLSYEYPNEYTIITGYLNEHGNISINRHGYAYCEEYTNPQTGTRKIFYYDEDRNNTRSSENDEMEYGRMISLDSNGIRYSSLGKDGTVSNNACGYAIKQEVYEKELLTFNKYYDSNSTPVSNKLGDFGTKFQYSLDGSTIRLTSLNKKYEPHMNDLGYSICDVITDIAGDAVRLYWDVKGNQVLPKRKFSNQLKSLFSTLLIKKDKPIINCRQIGATTKCILCNIERRGLGRKNGLRGTYVLIQFDNWHYGDSFEPLAELIHNSIKRKKHLTLLPITLSGSLMESVGNIIEYDFPAGFIGMRFVEWDINDDTNMIIRLKSIE